MPLRKYSGCRLIYFSIIKDIKPADRSQPTLSVFFLIFSFLPANPAVSLSLFCFFSSLSLPTATTINQKKRFKASLWPGRRSAIFRPPADKNVINERVVFEFEKNQETVVKRRRA